MSRFPRRSLCGLAQRSDSKRTAGDFQLVIFGVHFVLSFLHGGTEMYWDSDCIAWMGQRTIIEVCHGRYQIQVQERIESTPVVLKEERAASRTKGGGMVRQSGGTAPIDHHWPGRWAWSRWRIFRWCGRWQSPWWSMLRKLCLRCRPQIVTFRVIHVNIYQDFPCRVFLH